MKKERNERNKTGIISGRKVRFAGCFFFLLLFLWQKLFFIEAGSFRKRIAYAHLAPTKAEN